MNDCHSCPPTPQHVATVANLVPCPVPATPSSTPIVKPGGSTLPGTISIGNAVWLNDAERSQKRPAYVGQLGVQQDNWSVWAGLSTTAGAWQAVLNSPPAVWREMVWGPLEFLRHGAGSVSRRPVINPAVPFVIDEVILDLSASGTSPTQIDLMAESLVIATAYFTTGLLRVSIPAASFHPSYRTLPAGTQIDARVTLAGAANNYTTSRGLVVQGVGRWTP